MKTQLIRPLGLLLQVDYLGDPNDDEKTTSRMFMKFKLDSR